MSLSVLIGGACAVFALAWLVMVWAAWRLAWTRARERAWGDFKTGWKAGFTAGRGWERKRDRERVK